MKVVAIDCAPRNGATIYDGSDQTKMRKPVSNSELAMRLSEIKRENDNVLLCWDAPLTGPRNPQTPGEYESDFTQRPIEHFFSCKEWGYKAPKGISVRCYSGLSHWTITRAMLGLPIVGPYDKTDGLPFGLVCDNTFARKGHKVVEIHPGLAIWLWCKGGEWTPPADNWTYKREKKILLCLWNRLREVLVELRAKDLDVVLPQYGEGRTDDELDARVGYVLARMLVVGSRHVTVLGSQEDGSILLPNVDGLVKSYAQFRDKNVR